MATSFSFSIRLANVWGRKEFWEAAESAAMLQPRIGIHRDRAGGGTKNAKHCLRVPNCLCVIRRMNGFGWSNEVAIVAIDKETICVHVREPVVTAAQ